MAKQFFCKESVVNGVKLKVNSAMKMEVIITNLSKDVWLARNWSHCLGGKCISWWKVKEPDEGAIMPALPFAIAMDSEILALGRNWLELSFIKFLLSVLAD